MSRASARPPARHVPLYCRLWPPGRRAVLGGTAAGEGRRRTSGGNLMTKVNEGLTFVMSLRARPSLLPSLAPGRRRPETYIIGR